MNWRTSRRTDGYAWQRIEILHGDFEHQREVDQTAAVAAAVAVTEGPNLSSRTYTFVLMTRRVVMSQHLYMMFERTLPTTPKLPGRNMGTFRRVARDVEGSSFRRNEVERYKRREGGDICVDLRNFT